jgi:hypothetical protein
LDLQLGSPRRSGGQRRLVRSAGEVVRDEHGDVVAVILLLLREFAQRRGAWAGAELAAALRRLFHGHRVPQPVGREHEAEPRLRIRHD